MELEIWRDTHHRCDTNACKKVKNLLGSKPTIKCPNSALHCTIPGVGADTGLVDAPSDFDIKALRRLSARCRSCLSRLTYSAPKPPYPVCHSRRLHHSASNHLHSFLLSFLPTNLPM